MLSFEHIGERAALAMNAGDKSAAQAQRSLFRQAQRAQPDDWQLAATVAYHRGYAAKRTA